VLDIWEDQPPRGCQAHWGKTQRSSLGFLPPYAYIRVCRIFYFFHIALSLSSRRIFTNLHASWLNFGKSSVGFDNVDM